MRPRSKRRHIITTLTSAAFFASMRATVPLGMGTGTVRGSYGLYTRGWTRTTGMGRGWASMNSHFLP